MTFIEKRLHTPRKDLTRRMLKRGMCFRRVAAKEMRFFDVLWQSMQATQPLYHYQREQAKRECPWCHNRPSFLRLANLKQASGCFTFGKLPFVKRAADTVLKQKARKGLIVNGSISMVFERLNPLLTVSLDDSTTTWHGARGPVAAPKTWLPKLSESRFTGLMPLPTTAKQQSPSTCSTLPPARPDLP